MTTLDDAAERAIKDVWEFLNHRNLREFEDYDFFEAGYLAATEAAAKKCEAVAVLAERDALAIEVQALRTALREELISQPRKDVIKSGRCWLCRGEYWGIGEPEQHKSGCLAKDKGS